jgi:hypothetical protein
MPQPGRENARGQSFALPVLHGFNNQLMAYFDHSLDLSRVLV